MAASTFVIGCAVTIHSTIPQDGRRAERTCAILRSISDKSKFAVLQRLGQERSYGQKLAEEMNINPGHMSRILMALWGYGFLTREQEQGRYYYTTNKDSLHDFLRRAEQLLLGSGKKLSCGREWDLTFTIAAYTIKSGLVCQPVGVGVPADWRYGSYAVSGVLPSTDPRIPDAMAFFKMNSYI